RREVEHRLFLSLRESDPVDPAVVYVDMAGRAGTFPAAVGIDARHEVVDGRLHQRQTYLCYDGVPGSVVLDESYLRHFASSGTVPENEGRILTEHVLRSNTTRSNYEGPVCRGGRDGRTPFGRFRSPLCRRDPPNDARRPTRDDQARQARQRTRAARRVAG